MSEQLYNTPLYSALQQFQAKSPISLHVPGHKNGTIFSSQGERIFKDLLSIDLTELSGLDDLHAPDGIIAHSQRLAARWFEANSTYFLVGGSTVGNLAMLLATCSTDDKVIVQRNCHKSILNGLELSGASPIFVAPKYDEQVTRYTSPYIDTVKNAINMYPEAKAIVLTYPDYFGRAYDLESIIIYAHQFNIPVLVDEAHGVHFNLSSLFPQPALELGADVVVQSAHKTAPAMTMGSFLHIKSSLVSSDKIENYLQMLQSSSPSYPIMASLDLARSFLENISELDLIQLDQSIKKLRRVLKKGKFWDVLESNKSVDDPLKITIQINHGLSGYNVALFFEKMGIYPELASHNQVLFVHGLTPFQDWSRLSMAVEKINQQLKIPTNHATIDSKNIFQEAITSLSYSYNEMKQMKQKRLAWDEAVGQVSAEAIIPYPPGIPLITKGEMITEEHVNIINYLMNKGTTFQNNHMSEGINIVIPD